MTTLYDTVPYPRHAYGFTHPDRLATLAMLHGLETPPLERARILELGCASGANLVPMAYSLPDAEFLGVDLSARQIADGKKFVAAVGLKNIRLEAIDLQTIDEAFGSFDYIIAHGVYSWVPPAAQDVVLRICAQQLAPAGVALVSYNTYPGCHLRQMVRGMAQYHTRDIQDPQEQVEQLHGLVRFLAAAAPDDGTSYTRILRSEAARLAELNPAFLLHDVLEETNLPVYFHEFVTHAAGHGLQYVCEALPVDRRRAGLDPQIVAELRAKYPPLDFEQHLDFLDDASFRRTLLCHAEQPLRYDPAAVLDRLLIASSARPVSAAPDLSGPAAEEFAVRKDRYNASLRSDQPIAKAALATLADAYPKAMLMDALVAAAAQRLGRAVASQDRAQVGEIVMGGFPLGVVELHRWQPPAVGQVSSMPLAGPVARYEAAQGWEVTTLWHERFALADPVARQLVASLDGKHDRAALVDQLLAAMVSGGSRPAGAAEPSATAALRAEIARRLELALQDLARDALLIG